MKKTKRYFDTPKRTSEDKDVKRSEKVQVFEPDLSGFSEKQKIKTKLSHRRHDLVSRKISKNVEDQDKTSTSVNDPVGTNADSNAKTHDLSNLELGSFHSKPWKLKKSMKNILEEDDNKHHRDKYDKHKRDFKLRQDDPYPGDAPIPKEKIKKYKRGKSTDLHGVKTKFHTKKLEEKEKKYELASTQAARTELLLTEQAGFIEADEGDHTTDLTQRDIAQAVDISSAQKFFELKLDKFGPYRVNYTRNGRFLLIGGSRGHVAAIDWQTKKLMCEVNVMETCHDVQWLHIETMFAVAQRQWTYIYDNQGIELHCLKALDCVLRMEFLPYHFLLATGNSKGYLQWLDVSVGKKVAGYTTGLGRLDVMCSNPANAVLHMGHAGGTVTMWSPNVKEPLVKMLCHGGGTRSISITKDGQYMATAGIDRTLKIWDLRTLKLLHGYRIAAGPGHMSFSQRGLLATGVGNIVEVYKNPCQQIQTDAYLSHRLPGTVSGLQFCPYEDVLGVGHAQGFSSLLVPGAGEANFDALEANPYQSKKQRQQAEVKMLLEKIQPDMISLDTSALGQVDKKTLEETFEERQKLLYLKPKKMEDFEPRYKKKGRSKTGNLEKRKKGVQEEHKRDQIRQFVHEKRQSNRETQQEESRKSTPYNPLERFAKKGS